jgi:hypothetical protein
MTFSGSSRHKLLCVSTQNFVVLEIVVLVVNKHHETCVAVPMLSIASTMMKIDLSSSGEITDPWKKSLQKNTERLDPVINCIS